MSSLLTDVDHIQFWRKIYPNKQGIMLLDQYVSGNTLQSLPMRRQIYQSFCKSGDLFFEGLARMSGFGCTARLEIGNDLIRIAAVTRNCPEALNYLGLAYYAQGAPAIAVQLFSRAAILGHPKASSNLDFIRTTLNQNHQAPTPRTLALRNN